jgi:glyoxylase I family protein
MRLEHVALNVAEPDAMAAWYVAHMGMHVIRHAPTNSTYFLADSAGQSVIELYCNPAAAVPDYVNIPPLALHLAFVTADIAADHARLIAAGAQSAGPINPTPAGDQLAFLRDPWHVTIQLVQRATPLM